MRKLKEILFCTLVACFVFQGKAQVGIGNVVPDTSAILDLTNTNNRGLHLPTAPSTLGQSVPGILYYDAQNGILNYGTQNNYNGLSPWRYKFNYSFSEDVTYTQSGNVGIGTSTPFQKLHIASDGNILTLEGNGSARIGYYPSGMTNGNKGTVGYESGDSTKLVIRNNNIGGNVDFQMPQGYNLQVQGTLTENGNKLIYPGTIMMWSSSSPIPDGWAICNGNGSFVNRHGNVQAIPNLTNRFVRCTASAANQYYLDTGGEETTTLTYDQLPAHTHGAGTMVTTTNGDHFHYVGADGGSQGSNDGYTRRDDGYSVTLYTSTNGAHSHTLSGTLRDTGGLTSSTTSSHSNMPPYYALYFIIKL